MHAFILLLLKYQQENASHIYDRKMWVSPMPQFPQSLTHPCKHYIYY